MEFNTRRAYQRQEEQNKAKYNPFEKFEQMDGEKCSSKRKRFLKLSTAKSNIREKAI